MTGKIINGKEIAEKIRKKIKDEIDKFQKKPGLAVIIVGENEASKIYVSHKQKACKEVGIESYKYEFPKDTEKREIISLIEKLNKNDNINGILVQLPLPKHIDEKEIIISIDPKKDVDCFHPLNIGMMFSSNPHFLPATPKGIIKLLEETKINIAGKHAVVVGRSNIVGKPVSLLLLEKDATVTICHSETEDLKYFTNQADILVVAVGKPKLVTSDMIKAGAIIVDVGMNRVDRKLSGDVDHENIIEKASYITPVPGGVGPMTIAMLLDNTLVAYKKQNENP